MTPWEYRIWDAKQCAEYLHQSYSHFIKRTSKLDGFPEPCRDARPLTWPAKAVAEWHMGQQKEAA